MAPLPPADPEVAAARFGADLDALWASGRPDRLGWGRIRLDDLRVVVALPARRTEGAVDYYFALLGGSYYNAYPPLVLFVRPEDWSEVRTASRWVPTITNVSWFGLHLEYDFRDGEGPRQLVCYSLSAGYYESDHTPQPGQRWDPSRHTVAGTLYRLAEVLGPPYYQGPRG